MADVQRDNDDGNGGVEYPIQFSESGLSKSRVSIEELVE